MEGGKVYTIPRLPRSMITAFEIMRTGLATGLVQFVRAFPTRGQVKLPPPTPPSFCPLTHLWCSCASVVSLDSFEAWFWFGGKGAHTHFLGYVVPWIRGAVPPPPNSCLSIYYRNNNPTIVEWHRHWYRLQGHTRNTDGASS